MNEELEHPLADKDMQRHLKLYDKHGDFIYFESSNFISGLFWRNRWPTVVLALVGVVVYYNYNEKAGLIFVAIAGFIYLTLMYHRKGFVDAFEMAWKDGWDAHVDNKDKGKFNSNNE